MKTENVTTPQIESLGMPVILGISTMSRQRSAYWLSVARRYAGKIKVIDPDRRPLRSIRPLLAEMGITGKLYRASTGGKWGKSKEIVVI